MIKKQFLLPVLFLIGIFFIPGVKSFSQSIKHYEAEWKKVDELIQKKNLPKSALAEVNKIYGLAKKEKQDAQMIKSLIYITSLRNENRENSQVLAIREIEKEITLNKEPATSILKSFLADLYWQYFQQHRWQLYNRTNTTGFKKDDIATWTLEDYHRQISELYLQSVQNEKQLQATRLEPFDAIITKGNVRYLRPTLYDLLGQKALDYLKNDEREIKRPAYAFEITGPEAFAPAEQFIAQVFLTKDTFSLQHKALLLYEKLLRFHLNDARPDALIDADIDRLQFVFQKSVAENKEELYVTALENIYNKFQSNPVAAKAGFLLAAFYEGKAAQYEQRKDSAHRYSRVKAKDILEKIVSDSSRLKPSEGWTSSYNLLKEIMKPEFSFEVEKVNIPGQPFRALVKYKNLTNLNLRLIKADERIKTSFENTHETGFWTGLAKAAAIRSWQQALPATDDLQQHSVEIKIDALPVGDYVLMASNDKAFDTKLNPLGAGLVYVSNISYVGKDNNYFVLHRESGQPLQNAAVTVYQRQYNYQSSKYSKLQVGTHKTDTRGYFTTRLTNNKRDNSYYFDISYQNDRLYLNDFNYHYYYSETAREKEGRKIFFFTDRSIYRPGQTVYFKGLVITPNGKDKNVAEGYKTKVFLQNANGKVADSMSVTANEFGSFSGRFALPQNVFNGEFSIYSDREIDYANNARFSVEEYKRPKFYVAFEKIQKTYKVGDSIIVIGNAKAYAGNIISGANVSYRVIRQPRFLYPWLFKGIWPRSEPMELTHGEIKTDASGDFIVRFKAIPDQSIERTTEPLFDYVVYADVTDINGETRSSEQKVTAGYKSLLLNIDLPERLAIDSLKRLSVRTENLNGEYVSSLVQVNISRLVPENRLIRKRYWQQPDVFVMKKEEFINYFPHDEYKAETDYRTWQKGETIWSKQDSTKESSQFPIDNLPLNAGYYSIEIIAKDLEGAVVKDTRYVELFNPKTNTLIRPDYLWSKGSGTAIEPGQKATIQIGSSATNVFLISETDKNPPSENKGTKETDPALSFTTLSNEKKSFDYAITEGDRGGYGITCFFVKDNRFYQFTDVVNVPWTNKELNIEYATFRNKVLPGSEEKWKIKISGLKGDKVAAEMLAGMYDASLDQFRQHSWVKPDLWPVYKNEFSWTGTQNFTSHHSQQQWIDLNNYKSFNKHYDYFLFHQGYSNAVRIRGYATGSVTRVQSLEMANAAPVAKQDRDASNRSKTTDTAALEEVATNVESASDQSGTERSPAVDNAIQPRKNFNETAFFFPDLKTDKEGNIEFSFTIPEALTRWKLQTLAHTKALAFGLSSKEVITQKELMVQPNQPRFLREGDRMELSAKIVNLSGKELTGQAELQLLDATTNQAVDGWFQNMFPNQYFTVAAGGSEAVKFPIEVPHNFNKALGWRIVAKAGDYSDGEEAALPVLTNKTLVTETMPLPMRGGDTKKFSFEKLLKSGNSETLQHHGITVEYTSNPAWYVVQALPYLMEFPFECAEQIWNRYYANSLASKIVRTAPRMRQIFEQWKTADTAALLSNLQKNEELKSVLLQETPWVLEAKTEEQQKKNIALLFDMVRMSKELKTNFEQLKQMQSVNGGFVWFKGGPDDRYMTQYIVTGIGHLKKIGAIAADQQDELASILETALPYLDRKLKEDYDYLVKHKADLKKQQASNIQTQYLYMRSFFPEKPVLQASQTAYAFYRRQLQQHWMKGNKYNQGMAALALFRTGDVPTAKAILASLKETSVSSEEMGTYWKENSFGYSWYWWHAPIETQALLIEAFSEINKDTKTVADLKTWLLKNKQTNNWRTTKATADACYAFLLEGSSWLTNEPSINIVLGNTAVSNTQEEKEAGTGYFKKAIEAAFVKPEMGNISVSVKENSSTSTSISTAGSQQTAASWGAVYWQYFEDLDKITTAETPLRLTKKLFIEKNSDRGPVLTPVGEGSAVKIGDKLKVRIELRVDRDMEYVHMKDMRASAFEPANVLSGYKWQGGLGYYETTKDASINFFFNYLLKGTYVFEYPLFVTHTGDFSNGITSIQSMYAPEFRAHSEGVRVKVD